MAEPIFSPYNPTEDDPGSVLGPETVHRSGPRVSVQRTEGLPESKKHPYSEKQLEAAGFAITMESAAGIIDRIEAKGGGFLGATGPTGWWDTQVDKSFDTEIWERALMTSDYLLYDSERRRWMMAQLRWESGAAIPPEEIESGLLAYFPQPFDSEGQLAAKGEARRLAMSVMKTFGGGAYEEAKRDAYNRTPREEAIVETKQRAAENKEFEAEAIERGILSENWRDE